MVAVNERDLYWLASEEFSRRFVGNAVMRKENIQRQFENIKIKIWMGSPWTATGVARIIFHYISNTVKFENKPLHVYKPPQTGNVKKPSVKSPSKYEPPGGLKLENCPQTQSKTKQKW